MMLLAIPAGMDPARELAARRAYDKLQAAWFEKKGSAAALAIMTVVFEARHHLKDRGELTRPRLAQAAGCSERQVTRALSWLVAGGFVFHGQDASGRMLGTLMLRSEFLAAREFFHTDIPTTNFFSATGTSTSRLFPPHPFRCTPLRGDRLNSIENRPRASSPWRSNDVRHGHGASRRRRWSSAGEIARQFSQSLAPPGTA